MASCLSLAGLETANKPERGKTMEWRKVGNISICLGVVAGLVTMGFTPGKMELPMPHACMPTVCYEVHHEPPPNSYIPEFGNSIQQVIASGTLSAPYYLFIDKHPLSPHKQC